MLRTDALAGARTVRTAFAVAALATALFAAWLAVGAGGPRATLYVNDVGTILAALAASVLCARAGARSEGSLRRSWWLLAAACAAWTAGEVIWAAYDLVLDQAVPLPSWADLGYLGAIPLAVAALFSHPAMGSCPGRHARVALDGVLVATALLFLSWTFILGPLSYSSDLTTLGGLVGVAYPFGDVVIVFFVVLAVRRMEGGDRLAMWCLLAGMLALALSDSIYTYLTGVQSYASGSLLDAGWFIGYVAIALGAFCARGQVLSAVTGDAAPPSAAAVVVPFVPVLGALGVVAVEPAFVRELDPVTTTTAFALVLLVLGRQLLILRHARPASTWEPTP